MTCDQDSGETVLFGNVVLLNCLIQKGATLVVRSGTKPSNPTAWSLRARWRDANQVTQKNRHRYQQKSECWEAWSFERDGPAIVSFLYEHHFGFFSALAHRKVYGLWDIGCHGAKRLPRVECIYKRSVHWHLVKPYQSIGKFCGPVLSTGKEISA
jgi:hypothetical protein